MFGATGPRQTLVPMARAVEESRPARPAHWETTRARVAENRRAMAGLRQSLAENRDANDAFWRAVVARRNARVTPQGAAYPPPPPGCGGCTLQ